MHAAHNHVVDPALLEQVVDFAPVGADRVAGGDGDAGVLGLPGAGLFALRLAVAAAVGVVDRELSFDLLVAIVPLELEPRRDRRRRRGLRQLAARRALVRFHRVAGGVDDQHAAVAKGRHELVHPRDHGREAPVGPLAPVLVPDVDQDDGRVARVPLCLALGHVVNRRGTGDVELLPAAQCEPERRSVVGTARRALSRDHRQNAQRRQEEESARHDKAAVLKKKN